MIGIGTPTIHSKQPLPMTAPLQCCGLNPTGSIVFHPGLSDVAG